MRWKEKKKVSEAVFVSKDSHRFFRWSCVATVTHRAEGDRATRVQLGFHSDAKTSLEQISKTYQNISINYDCDFSEQ